MTLPPLVLRAIYLYIPLLYFWLANIYLSIRHRENVLAKLKYAAKSASHGTIASPFHFSSARSMPPHSAVPYEMSISAPSPTDNLIQFIISLVIYEIRQIFRLASTPPNIFIEVPKMGFLDADMHIPERKYFYLFTQQQECRHAERAGQLIDIFHCRLHTLGREDDESYFISKVRELIVRGMAFHAWRSATPFTLYFRRRRRTVRQCSPRWRWRHYLRGQKALKALRAAIT